MQHDITTGTAVTIGLDLGDTTTEGCVLDASGAELERFRTRTTRARLVPTVARDPGARVILEVGSQSPWVSRALTAAGCEVIVANARRVRLIAENDGKSDRLDAELLARLGRLDPALLAPIQHRGEQAQRDLSLVRTRAGLVGIRTQLINRVRGVAKALGHRLVTCAAARATNRWDIRRGRAGPRKANTGRGRRRVADGVMTWQIRSVRPCPGDCGSGFGLDRRPPRRWQHPARTDLTMHRSHDEILESADGSACPLTDKPRPRP